ncbi:sodium/potassium/calcium exchanger Nckx30C isoform X2 [Folsomia candida]|uniref:sodium/potassium/calcium exchanger Nckx30C isoform X2 n=1 Tax=Folsomia candida TaxID=158441 RepID=UPI0016052B93|nr:sodium/potassium/calcium exchanger Nckx30C isoform X2 [Folsomia candida]
MITRGPKLAQYRETRKQCRATYRKFILVLAIPLILYSTRNGGLLGVAVSNAAVVAGLNYNEWSALALGEEYAGGLGSGGYFSRQTDERQSLEEGDKNVINGTDEGGGKLFPPDLFTLEQRRKGAVIFYIIGVIYMFVALAIVCDEFFVPALDVIIEVFDIQDDVAGATFMAAGGSAPELFTSVIGVFISHDDVGIGTIVGSAVFNILFVIGMCALFSRTVLHLTWWPLFRDCTFYSVALITLICCFIDSYIKWWEALLLLTIYAAYVTFMKFNQSIESVVKRVLFKNRVTRVSSSDQLGVNNGASSSQMSVQTVSGEGDSKRGSASLKPPLSAHGRRNSIPLLHSGTKFRHGLLQLMIQSIDPLHDGRVDEKATQLHAIASLKALLDAAKTDGTTTVESNNRTKPVAPSDQNPSVQPADGPLSNMDGEDAGQNGDAPTLQEMVALDEAEQDAHDPLDISWPKGNLGKQISYVCLFPIMIVLYMTLPDTRTPRGKKFFVWGFLGSILWIAVFSYFMVWWADRTGETFGIAPEIMGLTFLAAGTSIPDLITSVIVARKGLGDMAVSSSVGSNIFDVCVGLPVPWLLYAIIENKPIKVSAKGMLCSVSILFGMLVFVVLSIMIFRWRMNKGLGLIMFVLYFIFLGVSLLFEYNVLVCPNPFPAVDEI